MYSFTVGDRVWVRSAWTGTETKEEIGHVVEVDHRGYAKVEFGQWSGITLKPDGFSPAGLFRLDHIVSKADLDSTRRT